MTAAGRPLRGAKPAKKAKPVKAKRPPFDGWRELVTPEGVDLRLRVGTYAERGLALLLDFLIMFGGLGVFTIVALIVASVSKITWMNEVLWIVWLLGFFVGRNFYFFWFEARQRAATPGKRALGLRVIQADGGALTADAVFARNAMREVEVFLPLTFFFAQGEGVDAALAGLGGIWGAVLVLFPLFNRDRRRLGDLAAGTMVVKQPKRQLQSDLADTERTASAGLVFTTQQLDAYGIKELHVLEDVIRVADRKAITEVAARIRAKIGWQGGDVADRTFLNAYYAALRGRLESRLLFGRRRKDKFDVD